MFASSIKTNSKSTTNETINNNLIFSAWSQQPSTNFNFMINLWKQKLNVLQVFYQKMTPGKQRDRNFGVPYSIPINFKLKRIKILFGLQQLSLASLNT